MSLERATSIVRRLNEAGYTAYFAGGWVRDFLMGHPSEDIDIATNAPLQIILDLFPRTYQVGIAFGVVIVAIEGDQFEVATFRRDLDYESGRRPRQIELAAPEEDALRRDFTINGMFYDPLNDKVIDFVGGAHDLKRRLIRTIGDPFERFFEDRLRMIRAVRFAARFGFTIDLATEEAIRENSDLLFPAVAVERVWQELSKMARYPASFDSALITLHRLELLPILFPQLQGVHLQQIKARVAPFSQLTEDCPPLFLLLQLFPEASDEELLELVANYKLSRTDKKIALTHCKVRQWAPQLLGGQNECNLWEWTQLLADPYSDLALHLWSQYLTAQEQLLFRERLRPLRQRLKGHVDRLIDRKPLLSGRHLERLGISPGPPMGRLLDEAERMAVEKNLHEVTELLPLLQQTPLWSDALNH